MYRLSVRPSVVVCHTHGFVKNALKLGICSFDSTVAPSIAFAGLVSSKNFHGTPDSGVKQRVGVGKIGYFLALCVNISKTVGDTSKVTINN